MQPSDAITPWVCTRCFRTVYDAAPIDDQPRSVSRFGCSGCVDLDDQALELDLAAASIGGRA